MTKEPVRVSDHALCRYLERAMGLNIELVREHIATICSGPAAIGAVCLRAEGVRFEITNNTVITVRPDDGSVPGKTTRDRNQRHIERRIENAQR
jgi:hypothetical protein